MVQIKLKRGNNINLAGLTLEAGEPAFVIDTGKLYVGNGTEKVLINPDVSTNALTADKLKTARTITVAGDVAGSASFDGSTNITITTELKDSVVTAGTYPKVTVDDKGIVTAGSALVAGDIPSLTLSKLTDAGTAASKNVGVAAGNVPVLNAQGKLDDNVLPAIAITNTFVVATEAAMLALTVEIGDVCVRTDLNKSFILKSTPSTNIASWQELLNPLSSVSSVAGKTGAVTLSSADVGLGNVTNESKATMFTSPALTGTPTAPTAAAATNTTQVSTTAFVKSQGYATLASPTFTGTASAPTPTTADNSTKIATTAYVQAQGYLAASSVLDGGTF